MKIRKFAALALAFSLLTLPLLSQAAPASFLNEAYEAGRSVKTTVTFLPGESMARGPSLQLASDLLSALRIEAAGQKAGSTELQNLVLFLNDEPSLSLTALAEDDQFHIMSNFLGEQVLSFTPEEYFALYANMLEESGAGEEAPALMQAYMKMYASLLKGELFDLSKFDAQSLQDDLLEPLNAWFEALLASPEVTAGVFESGRHDTAATKIVYSLSPERIAGLLTILTGWAVKEENLDQLLAIVSAMLPEYGDLSQYREDIRNAYQALPDSFRKEAAPAFLQPISLSAFLDGEDLLKAVEIKAQFAGNGPGEPSILITAGQYIKTEADGVTTLYSLDVKPDKAKALAGELSGYGFRMPGADSVSISFSKKDIPNEAKGDETVARCQWRFVTVVKGSGVELLVLRLNYSGLAASSARAVNKDWTLNVYASPNGRATGVVLAGSEKSVLEGKHAKAEGKLALYSSGSKPDCSVAYTVSTGAPEELPAIPKDSVRLGRMTVEELQAWGEEAAPVAMGQWMGLLSNLPPSILKVIYGSAAGE